MNVTTTTTDNSPDHHHATTTLISILAQNVVSKLASGGIKTISSRVNDDNDDLGYSPVTLSSDWPRVARLLLLASLAVIGSVGNVFMISAIMVEDHLKKRGNAFLVNVALADLLVTGMVLPASALVILAGQEGQWGAGVCRVEWTLGAVCFFVTIITFPFIAIENYVRLCQPMERYEKLGSGSLTATILCIWLTGASVVAALSFVDFGLDFCLRRFEMVIAQKTVGAIGLVSLPALITLYIFCQIVRNVRKNSRGAYKPPVAFSWEYELIKVNMYSFAMFVMFWLPFVIALCISPARQIRPSVFYNLAWLALSKSCFNNLLYCVVDRHFRNAYVQLFHYCCCKTTVSFSRRPRGDAGRSSGNVRLNVHIIHSYANPSSCRPTNSRPNGRDDVML